MVTNFKHLQIVACTKWLMHMHASNVLKPQERSAQSYACPAHKRSSHAAGGISSSGKRGMKSHCHASPASHCCTIETLWLMTCTPHVSPAVDARFLLYPGYVLRKAQASAELPNTTTTGREQRPQNDYECALRAHTSSTSHPPNSSHQLGEHDCVFANSRQMEQSKVGGASTKKLFF